MKATVSTVGHFYSKEEAKPLIKLGFKSRESKCLLNPRCSVVIEGTVKVEIKSLEELVAFIEEHGQIVLNTSENGLDLVIYDDYME